MESGADTRAFETAVTAHDGTVSKTTAAAFEDALSAALDEPAVGVPIPIDGISLESTPVELTLTPSKLEAAHSGVTAASFGIGSLGTVFLESRQAGDEPVSLFPERHVVILAASDIVADLESAFERLEAEFTAGPVSGILASGPSATADMGATVQGVHGPSEVHVIVVTDR